MATKTAPKGLGPKARKLWRDMTAKYEFRVDELAILEQACRELDMIEKLQELIDDEYFEYVVAGSMGQDAMNPVLIEIRQHRALHGRLLKQLDLPDDNEAAAAGSQSSVARAAAEARWGKRGA